MYNVQAGEIVDDWIKRDEKDMEEILNKNRSKDKYWVILFQNVLPGKKVKFHGGTPIIRFMKAYDTKPRPLVGAQIAEVDNRKGKITWRSYPKDIPVDWKKITDEELHTRQLISECDIPGAYIYNKA